MSFFVHPSLVAIITFELQTSSGKCKTSPDVVRCLVSGLNSWHWDEPCHPLLPHYSSSFHQAWEDQLTIGWFQLLCSGMSSSWMIAQEEWWTQQTMEWELLTEKWSKCVITALLEITWNMWEHCSHCLHDSDDLCHANLKTARDEAIRNCFRTHSPKSCLQCDCHLFQSSCVATLAHPQEEKQLWLDLVCAASSREINQDTLSQHQALCQDTRAFLTICNESKV